jgi:Na+-translocating ferredoxin:NAD+ oxidoreductase subunit B
MPPAPIPASADDVDALLPQTQCRRCEYPSCRAYAEAIVRDDAPINRCPPGGDATLTALARLLDRPALALDPRYGTTTPLAVAHIDEATCIGCTLCIQACPTDAIVGAAKLMHTVLVDRCTGCELCLPPCPVDCIAMPAAARPWGGDDAERARRHFLARNARLASDPARWDRNGFAADSARLRRRAAVDAALARARSRRAGGER